MMRGWGIDRIEKREEERPEQKLEKPIKVWYNVRAGIDLLSPNLKNKFNSQASVDQDVRTPPGVNRSKIVVKVWFCCYVCMYIQKNGKGYRQETNRAH